MVSIDGEKLEGRPLQSVIDAKMDRHTLEIERGHVPYGHLRRPVSMSSLALDGGDRGSIGDRSSVDLGENTAPPAVLAGMGAGAGAAAEREAKAFSKVRVTSRGGSFFSSTGGSLTPDGKTSVPRVMLTPELHNSDGPASARGTSSATASAPGHRRVRSMGLPRGATMGSLRSQLANGVSGRLNSARGAGTPPATPPPPAAESFEGAAGGGGEVQRVGPAELWAQHRLAEVYACCLQVHALGVAIAPEPAEEVRAAVSLLGLARRVGVLPPQAAYHALLQACATAGLVEQSRAVFEQLVRAGGKPDAQTIGWYSHALIEGATVTSPGGGAGRRSTSRRPSLGGSEAFAVPSPMSGSRRAARLSVSSRCTECRTKLTAADAVAGWFASRDDAGYSSRCPACETEWQPELTVELSPPLTPLAAGDGGDAPPIVRTETSSDAPSMTEAEAAANAADAAEARAALRRWDPAADGSGAAPEPPVEGDTGEVSVSAVPFLSPALLLQELAMLLQHNRGKRACADGWRQCRLVFPSVFWNLCWHLAPEGLLPLLGHFRAQPPRAVAASAAAADGAAAAGGESGDAGGSEPEPEEGLLLLVGEWVSTTARRRSPTALADAWDHPTAAALGDDEAPPRAAAGRPDFGGCVDARGCFRVAPGHLRDEGGEEGSSGREGAASSVEALRKNAELMRRHSPCNSSIGDRGSRRSSTTGQLDEGF